MVSDVIDRNDRFRGILDRLATKSIDDYYNPYRLFEWPDQLPEDMWWMSPELTTTYGTEWAEKLTPEQLHTLSKHESVNFYSLNVHGIRELLVEVVNRIHTAGFETPSEFFHHFIGEENEHMWFFAEFCLRYGKKIYRQPSGGAEAAVPSDKIQSLLVFARILIFEELVDHFNSAMAEDERLHETIRGINRIHHQDESRHIAFGRELVNLLHQDLKQTATEQELDEVSTYLRRYMKHSFESLYHPQVYRDAGIERPHELRRALLESPARAEAELRTFRKTAKYLEKTGLIR
ncbi:diiron oxygenase [Streptomyces microflavus]|uniref:Membrane protein n=2 Tax=Streptomyces microflavus TaxID=1919 RepID=A0A7J0CRG7_STRMI|nr:MULTISPECIES: diiron oxygenase [Streptomyces]AGK78050.1 AurF domain containing protein [Streptomyces microflavus DSM 40593]MCX4653273.1 diiron oxygenase [Streptomyces microflavus]MDX2402935.1 diiron oxygenase [Streptomyces microflavus]MDX2979925.1 diiron oxygenase [Streptomyces sp. NRRL_B-2249]WSA61516.1 diiron oxygenase [Streptomyces microflavus]